MMISGAAFLSTYSETEKKEVQALGTAAVLQLKEECSADNITIQARKQGQNSHLLVKRCSSR